MHCHGIACSIPFYHRDKTRVQMSAKKFPQLKVKCQLFMDPTLGLTQSNETVFFDQIWCFFTIKTRF